MSDKKMRRKLRKQCKRLLKWCKRNGVGRVDVYVNAESEFVHAYIPDGPSYIDFMGGELDE